MFKYNVNFENLSDFPGPANPRYSYLYPEESIEFSSNLTYLGKKGLLNTASGLQIAYLSGVEGSSKDLSCFDKADVEELLIPLGTQVGFSGTDILLTSVWPADIARHSHNQPSKPQPGSVLLSKLAAHLKPRYHFAGLGVHYERQPYRNHRVLLEPARHTTRFIGKFCIQRLIINYNYFRTGCDRESREAKMALCL